MYIILIIVGIVIGLIIGLFLSLRLILFIAKKKDENIYKFQSYYKLMIKLMYKMMDKEPLFLNLKENGYVTIAIYGCADMGILLYSLLSKEGYNIEFFLDKNLAGQEKCGIEIRKPSQNMDNIDCVIVTPYLAFDEIENELRKKMNNVKVVSLKQLIN